MKTRLPVVILALAGSGLLGFASSCGDGAGREKTGKVVSDIESIKFACKMHRLERRVWPASLNDLVVTKIALSDRTTYLEKLPSDPWGRPYRYSLSNDAPVIVSAGPDGRFGTADDQGGDRL